MEFKKYQHVERFGTSEVNSIEIGECYVFPKIDGTNSSVWLNNGEVCAGSRNRQLSIEKDNAGFYSAIKDDTRIKAYLTKHPDHRLYGEWLVPHSIKTYRDDAWKKFYVFDVCVDAENADEIEYLPFSVYEPLLKEFELDYIAPLAIIKNGDAARFTELLDKNVFLVKDGCGVGEGVVIKNYDYENPHHHKIWAKIVTSEFREKHTKAMGAPVIDNRMVEEEIVNEYVTSALVEKEFAKIESDHNEWSSKYIPQLLGQVYYSLIQEEMWNILKQFKSPSINFKTLNALTINKIKAVKKDIFC